MTKKKKGFLGKLVDKLDKEMEKKSKKKCCCCNTSNDDKCCK